MTFPSASLLSWAYGERLPLLPKASGATLPHLALSEKLIVLVVANQVRFAEFRVKNAALVEAECDNILHPQTFVETHQDISRILSHPILISFS